MLTQHILILNAARHHYGNEFALSISEIGLASPIQTLGSKTKPINFNFGRVSSLTLNICLYLFVKDSNLSLPSHLQFFVDNGISKGGIAVFIVDSSYTGTQVYDEERTGWPYIADAKHEFQALRTILPTIPFVICAVNQDRPASLNHAGIRAALNASEDTRVISCMPEKRASVVCVLLELVTLCDPDEKTLKTKQLLQSLLSPFHPKANA
jgi:hypothetical protein